LAFLVFEEENLRLLVSRWTAAQFCACRHRYPSVYSLPSAVQTHLVFFLQGGCGCFLCLARVLLLRPVASGFRWQVDTAPGRSSPFDFPSLWRPQGLDGGTPP